MEKNFEKYAEFYDIFYRDKDYKMEAEILRSLMSNLKISKFSEVLEIGCGTGKHLEHIAQHYPKSIGVEPSSFMIARACPSVRERIEKQSAETLSLQKKFHFIYMLFHVFSYIDDIGSFFNNMYKHLNPNGMICIDFWQSSGVFFHKPETRSKWMVSGSSKIQRIATPQVASDGKYVDIKYDIYVHNSENNAIEYFGEKHRMYVRSEGEIIAVAEQHGLAFVNKCHLTSDKPPKYTDWDSGLIFKKTQL